MTTVLVTSTLNRDRTLVVKWDLDNWQPMKGHADARLKRLLKDLVEEGQL